MTEASRAGKKALSLFLSEYHDEVGLGWPRKFGRSKVSE
jgi:hypothetical protein